MVLALFRFQEVAGLDLVQAKVLLDLSDQRLAAAVVVAVADDRPVDPDPAGRYVDMVAMADRHVTVVSHPLGPAPPNLAPFLGSEIAILGTDSERLVDDRLAERRAELS